MTTSPRLDDVLSRAFDLDEPDRSRFVREQLGDAPDLLREALSLLEYDDPTSWAELESFSARPADVPLPAFVGPYRVLERIGQGGMGTVYLAEQSEPKRRVAIKTIRGFATPEFLLRFRFEHQSLATMNHPAIATVFDAAATTDGTPYYVMEYVPGRPIHRYCDDEGIGLVDRIELFTKVCEAVQHAHLRGIVHRDLKPSNVLVTEQDGVPQPKVIDFGIAKAIDAAARPEEYTTRVGAFLGTPEYMSPEQTTNEDVDARTDLYSLGVILYQLLTGSLPLPSELFDGASPADVERVLRERQPEPPSRRSTAAGAMTARTTARTTARALRGELDWIVLKALHKDREQRYESAQQFADDLAAYLRGDPVLAGPPTWRYRTRRVLWKHRWLVGSLLFIVLVLLPLGGYAGFLTLRNQQVETNLSAFDARRELGEIEAAADALFPPYPHQKEAISESIRRLEAVLAQRPKVEAALVALQARADSYGARARLIDQASHPRADHLRTLRDRLRAHPDNDILREEIARVAHTVKRRRWARFDSVWDQIRHDHLCAFLDRLDRHSADTGLLQRLRVQLSWAERLEKNAAACTERWQPVLESVRQDPRFASVELRPHLDLWPIGRNQAGLWEFVHIPSHEASASEEPSLGECGIVFVLLPGARCWMGAQSSEPSAAMYDPVPFDPAVTLTEVDVGPFFIAKYELNQGQWFRLTGTRISQVEPGMAHPLESVSWPEAAEILDRFDLDFPTEEQWEYAARAGTTSRWCFGDDARLLPKYGNVADRSAAKQPGTASWGPDANLDDRHVVHAPSRSFEPNGWDLYDMIGNVWEWCRTEGAAIPSDDPAATATPTRVVRGGSFAQPPERSRAAFRLEVPIDTIRFDLGVRPIRAIDRVPRIETPTAQ